MRLTLLSNGHGEDVVGALLAEAFLACDGTLELRAFPTVGGGGAYERLNIPVLGPRRALPSGGFMLHSLDAFRRDVQAGFLPMTTAQLRTLRSLETDVLIVVGDVYALLLSSLVGTRQRFYVQTLVSAWQRHLPSRLLSRPRHLNRYFMERFSGPERLLIRRLARHSYVRDAPTAALLKTLGLSVSALGNPMLDALHPAVAPPLPLPVKPPVVALLPGTREHKKAALETMVRALECWPEATGLVAWTDGAPPSGSWRAVAEGVWQGAPNVYLLTDRFAAVLGAAQLALGTAGTAHEQAAASGLPVVAFAAPPIYTPAFLANQRRLLGEALSVCDPDPQSVAATLRALWCDTDRYRRAAAAGRERMGAAGGSVAIARDVLRRVCETAP